MTYFTPFFLSIFAILLLSGCDSSKGNAPTYQWELPKDFPLPQVPLDNPMSVEKVELGRFLFYEVKLSANQTQSCASCHSQQNAFAESLKTSIGSTGQVHRRNSPALVNIAFNKTLTWAHDGLDSIEQQLLLPMFGEAPIELGITGNEQQVLARFQQATYTQLFSAAFPEQDVSFDLIVKALSSFVRSLISLDSRFDRYAYFAEDDALNESELRGMSLFFSEKLECHHCHGGFNFTQSTTHQKQLLDRRPFHNTGLYNINASSSYPKSDSGLSEVSLVAADNGRFRAPTLRNIQVSAPYMHDGSIQNLSEVIEFYAAGGRNIEQGDSQGDGRKNKFKSAFIKGFEISAEEKQDLLNFLNTLTDQNFLHRNDFASPFVHSEKK